MASTPLTPSAEKTTTRPPGGPAFLTPLANAWKRVSPSLVPALAVLTALLVTIPFMMLTGGRGDLGRGFNIAMTAYSAAIEGSLGIVINDVLSYDAVTQVRALADFERTRQDSNGETSDSSTALDVAELRALSTSINRLVEVGAPQIRHLAGTIAAFEGRIDAESIDALGERIPGILEMGAENLRAVTPLLAGLSAMRPADSGALLRTYSPLDDLSDEDYAAIVALLPAATDYSSGDLLTQLKLISGRGTVIAVQRLQEQLAVLDALEISVADPAVSDFVAISLLKTTSRTGSQVVSELLAADTRLTEANITDETALAAQLNLVNAMYQRRILTNPDVATALNTELEPFIAQNFVVFRPGQDPLLIDPGYTGDSNIIYNTKNTPDDTSDDSPEVLYQRLGNKALLFFPANLEQTITRAIPFIIAGLAVALGFKAGVFNIGAEGQLYMGGVLAVWVGFSPAFDFLQGPTRVLAVLIAGIIGGGLWGMIPGALKAFTGAHEVINTIMLNFIAIRFTDWLIQSKDPYILRDPVASVDQTPNVVIDAVLPRFNEVSPMVFVLAALAVLALSLYQRREALQNGQYRAVIRPVIEAALVLGLCLYMSWATMGGRQLGIGVMHLGFVVMLGAVWFVDWFLNRTTPGFALRTVGANPNAARYAGMNVKWNLVLALMMSGALAGLAGAIELSSVQYNMKPHFFSGLGFEAIAVALLARSNPRSMIAAGLLWAALATGAGPMQLRADIPVDLVKIIQALIIMFVAADAIVRWLWRVPSLSDQEKAVQSGTTFAKGWGS